MPPARAPKDIDPDKLERLYAVTTTAFHEDKRIIEAQQKLIDLEPERAMLPTSLDAGPTQFRKLVETMARRGNAWNGKRAPLPCRVFSHRLPRGRLTPTGRGALLRSD